MTVQQHSENEFQFVALGFVRQLLNDVLGSEPSEVVAHAMLVDDLGADSLDMVEIQMLLEERGISAPDSMFHIGITAGHLADLIVSGTCARCEGLGEWDEGPLPAHSAALEPEYRQVTCPNCEGTGSIHKVKGGFSWKRLGSEQVAA